MDLKCANCGIATKFAVKEGDKCLACAMGWHKDGPDAGIAGLRALIECNPKQGERECGECMSCQKEKRVISEAVLVSERKTVQILRDALAFYADPKWYIENKGPGFKGPQPVVTDQGKKARLALGLQP